MLLNVALLVQCQAVLGRHRLSTVYSPHSGCMVLYFFKFCMIQESLLYQFV